jgi:hypothetical protein
MIPFDDDRDPRFDLLVDGELDPESRRDLLLGLDASADGWRTCALAFLEAQAMRSAIAPAARERTAPMPVVAMPVHRRKRPVAWIPMAASVLAAFGLGWASHAPGNRAETIRDRMATAPRPSPEIVVRSPKPTSVPDPVAATQTRRKTAPVSYVQGKLEREGYRLEQRVWLVPASTKDGRRVAVPVRQTAVRFVGNRAV